MRHEPKKRILVVDDEQYICRIIIESLGEDNFDIAAFSDPREALDYLAANPIDLVLSDLVMGEYSGIQVLEAALENHPDAIVILMTAHPTVQTAISVLKHGGFDFLVKPFKLEMLNATIKRGLEHQKILRDNISLKGQVEFLKVANTFFGTGQDLDPYLELVLNSCNTELAADASAIIQIDPDSRETIRRLSRSSEEDAAAVLDESLLAPFLEELNTSPSMKVEPFLKDTTQMHRILITNPVYIRKTLHGVINVRLVSRSEMVPHGQLDALSILASSAASAIANQKLYHDLQNSYLQAITALANSIEARDQYTAGHTDRVMKIAEQIARELGWRKSRINDLRMGCTLHDIGKIGVPDAILNKAGILTDEERARMQEHPQLGLQIIRGIDLFKPSVPYIIGHHERYDGQGYPEGLKGNEIPEEGRLLAVADTFDAIMSDRPYRKGAEIEVAIRELTEHSGTQFDPAIVRAFYTVLKSGKIDFTDLYGRDFDVSCLDEILNSEMELA